MQNNVLPNPLAHRPLHLASPSSILYSKTISNRLINEEEPLNESINCH